jgi:hypothetical protein
VDIIETLKILKEADKDKITGAEQAQVTAQSSPVTGAGDTQKVAEQPPPPLPTDLPRLLAAFQQFLAASQQSKTGSGQLPNTLPKASEHADELDSTYDSEQKLHGRLVYGYR